MEKEPEIPEGVADHIALFQKVNQLAMFVPCQRPGTIGPQAQELHPPNDVFKSLMIPIK